MKRLLKIKITKEFKLICSVIDSKNNETFIKLQENDSEEYSLCFTLENNRIDFIDDFIQNPREYKLYRIQYKQKQFKVIAEVLLTLILNDFVKKVKKEFIL